MNYSHLKFIIPACILGVSYIMGCKNVEENTASKNHLSRLELNKQLSKILSKNSNPRFKYLLAKLDTVYLNDQKFRDVYDDSYLRKNSEKQRLLDKQNQYFIGAILDSFGYLNKADIGQVGEKAVNLTLLHSDLNFKKKYRPVVENAFRQKKMIVNTYANFIDRILIEEKKLQKYGTQIIKFRGETIYYPINIDSLNFNRNQLRSALDTLDPLNLYPDVTIDKETYKKLLPELRKIYKIKTY